MADTMPATPFTLGDHVRVHTAISVVRAGAVGTIQLVYRYLDLYDVQFDGYAQPKLMRGRELERVAAVL
jgi:hypothetical protein